LISGLLLLLFISLQAAAISDATAQQGLEQIRVLIHDDKIEQAADAAEALFSQYPDDEAVMLQYATLLFWQGEAEKAQKLFDALIVKEPSVRERKVYQQNETLIKVQKAQKLLAASPKEAASYLEGLSQEARSDYDLHLLYVQSLIRSGELEAALKEAERFYRDFPESGEVQLLLADLLFWQGHYDKSLQLYRSRYDSAPTEQLQGRIAEVEAAKEAAVKKMDKAKQILFYKARYEAEKDPQDGLQLAHLYLETGAVEPAMELLEKMSEAYPRDLEITRLYMASLIDTYQKREANHLLYELDDDAVEALREKYPLLYCRTLVNKLEAGGIFYDYSDDRYSDNTAYVQYETPIGEYILVGLLQEIWRYGLRDTDIGADLYRAFEEKWWGYLTFSLSPEANFMPQIRGGGHLYKGLGDFELGFGYEYSHYKTTDVHMFIPEYSYFFLGGFTWTQKLYYVPDSESYALVTQLGYESNCRYKVKGEYTWANSNERIENIDAFQNAKNNGVRLSGEYRLRPEWTLGGAVSYGSYATDTGDYTQSGLQLYVRRAW